MYENIKIRLADFASSVAMSDKDFETAIGMPRGTLRRLESEVKSSVISNAMRVFPQLSPDWLLNGEGPMLRSLREHPSVITTVPGDSSSGEDDHATHMVSEPTPAYHGIKSKDITLPVRVYEELLNQLKKKDQQLEDASAQIRTLFEMLNSHNI